MQAVFLDTLFQSPSLLISSVSYFLFFVVAFWLIGPLDYRFFCIGTLDRKAAFEICVTTHGVGKATVTKTWKKQAEKYCLGLQRQGLTVSIAPDKDFDGGHAGGGQ